MQSINSMVSKVKQDMPLTKEQQKWIDNLPGERVGIFFVSNFDHLDKEESYE